MFDARAAKALQPGQHLIVDDAPGLRLVAAESRRTWIYRYRSPVDQRVRQIRLGHWPAMGLPAALAAWQKVREQRDAGTDPARDKRERRRQAAVEAREGQYTVRKACDDFLSSYAGTVTPKTYGEAERLLARELDAIENRPAASITRADAFDLLDGMRGRPVVAAALRRVLGAAWDRALDAGRLAPDVPNWWRLVLRGKLPSKGKIIGGEHQGVEKRVLSEAELQLLLPWMPNFTGPVEDALTMILWTACRGAEVVAMEAEEITDEPDGWWWTVPREKLKMRRNPLTVDLRVPLEGRALAIVKRRLQVTPKGHLFPSRADRGHIDQKALGVAVYVHMPHVTFREEWVRPRLPVSGWAPHDLRRTARTLLASLGCPTEVAEAILGHAQPGIVGTYNRFGYEAERRVWLKRLSAKLEVLGQPAPSPAPAAADQPL